jgi:copper chaperone
VGDQSEFALRIEGMHCGACVRRVSQALASVPGVSVGEVRIGAARVRFPGGPSRVDDLLAALEKAGYAARLDA